jgi:ribosomal-protein-alanine N-acetyltransferase
MTVIDAAGIGGIDARAFDEDDWPESTFLAELRENRFARYFVLAQEPGAELLGYIGCWTLADALHIVTIGVEPAQQRRGFGDLLVTRALDLAFEAGLPAATLECRASNLPAQALYTKFGFHVAGRRRRYYADKEDALIMTAAEVCSAPFRARLDQLRAASAARSLIPLTIVMG